MISCRCCRSKEGWGGSLYIYTVCSACYVQAFAHRPFFYAIFAFYIDGQGWLLQRFFLSFFFFILSYFLVLYNIISIELTIDVIIQASILVLYQRDIIGIDGWKYLSTFLLRKREMWMNRVDQLARSIIRLKLFAWQIIIFKSLKKEYVELIISK